MYKYAQTYLSLYMVNYMRMRYKLDNLFKYVFSETRGIWEKNQEINVIPFYLFILFIYFFFNFFIYFWDRERQSMNGGGTEKEGDTESETGSRL